MQVQVSTDNHIDGSARLAGHVEAVVEGALDRFGNRITRVEVHFTDENSHHKSGDADKHCVLEARLTGLQPIAVSADGETLNHALDGAVDKLERTLDRTLGRRDDPKGRKRVATDLS